MRFPATLVPAFLLLGGCGPDEGPLPVVGTLERDRVEIVAEAWEALVTLDVAEGESVRAGDLIASQDTESAHIELARSRHARDRALHRLAELERGPRREVIEEAKAHLAGAESRSEIASREFRRVEDLVRRNLASESDLDAARMDRDLALADRAESMARLDALLAGTTSEELRQAQAALAEAEAAVASRELRLDRLAIRAPRDGVIDALPVEVGDRPQAGEVIAVLLTGSAPYARVYVPAGIRARVVAGTAAEVRADSVDDVFEGRVRTVAEEASFTPYFALTERDRSRLTYVAEVELGDAARGLPAGIPVEVDFPSLRAARE